MSSEIPQSEQEKSYLNLKTNPEETIAAMRRVEDVPWEAEQKRMSGYTVDRALKWLRGEGENDTDKGGERYIINGLGAMHRYYVDRDGTISFSKRHSSPKYIQRAEAEGFKIQ